MALLHSIKHRLMSISPAMALSPDWDIRRTFRATTIGQFVLRAVIFRSDASISLSEPEPAGIFPRDIRMRELLTR